MIQNNHKIQKILDSFSKVSVLIVGDIILDRFLKGSSERISPEAPVPIVDLEEELTMLGGASNVASNVSHLGSHAYLLGAVGTDYYGSLFLNLISKTNIDFTGIIKDSTKQTTVKDRVIANGKQVARVDREQRDDLSFEKENQIFQNVQRFLPSVQVLIIEDYSKGVITDRLIQMILKEANNYHIPVIVDPKDKKFHLYKGATIVTPNHKEAEQAVGFKIKDNLTLCECGQSLLNTSESQAILITRGDKGMSLFQKNNKTLHIPTIAKSIFDISGAGDTVVATMALALASGASFEEATILSNVAAGIVVCKPGISTVTLNEMREVLCKQLV